MKAVVMRKNGGNEVVEVRDMPRPAVGVEDVLIEVHAASLNPVDIKIRNGLMNILHRYRFPTVMGCDAAGKVVEVGSGVKRFKAGDDVLAYTGADRLGAFAEFLALPESAVALKPGGVTWEQAASIPLVSLTVYKALVEVAKVQPGQRVFLRSGSGGIGVFGIQLAKTRGVEVITTTSTPNVGWVKDLGADRVIDYKKEDFAEVVRDCDVVFETLPKAEMLKSFSVVKRGGCFISIGDMADGKFAREFGKNKLMQMAFDLVAGPALRAARKAGCDYHFFLVAPDGVRLSEIAGLVEAGKVKPVVDRVFPLDQAREALDYLAAGRAKGKIALSVKS